MQVRRACTKRPYLIVPFFDRKGMCNGEPIAMNLKVGRFAGVQGTDQYALQLGDASTQGRRGIIRSDSTY